MGVGEIAATKHVSTDTIYNHLAQLIEQGLITTFGTIISRKEYEDIVNELKVPPRIAYDVLKERHRSGMVAIARAIGRTKGVLPPAKTHRPTMTGTHHKTPTGDASHGSPCCKASACCLLFWAT